MRELMTTFVREPFFPFGGLQDFFNTVDEEFGRPVREAIPRGDIAEKDTHYLVSFDLPGVAKEDIHIEAYDSKLKVSGERKAYSEKSYGRFERIVTLPEGVDSDGIMAHHENGVLAIAIPKAEEAKPKKIAITQDKSNGLWGRLLGTTKKSA